MTIEKLTDPTIIAIVVLLALAFIRFGVWWALLRVLLAPLLRPAGLVIVALAVVAVMKFS